MGVDMKQVKIIFGKAVNSDGSWEKLRFEQIGLIYEYFSTIQRYFWSKGYKGYIDLSGEPEASEDVGIDFPIMDFGSTLDDRLVEIQYNNYKMQNPWLNPADYTVIYIIPNITSIDLTRYGSGYTAENQGYIDVGGVNFATPWRYAVAIRSRTLGSSRMEISSYGSPWGHELAHICIYAGYPQNLHRTYIIDKDPRYINATEVFEGMSFPRIPGVNEELDWRF